MSAKNGSKPQVGPWNSEFGCSVSPLPPDRGPACFHRPNEQGATPLADPRGVVKGKLKRVDSTVLGKPVLVGTGKDCCL